MLPETEIWLDAQLSPAISTFIFQTFTVSCKAMRELGLRDADDAVIFTKAKEHAKRIIIVTKDSDFVDLLIRQGAPPKIIFLTCGNTSNDSLKEILSMRLQEAIKLLDAAENNIVEITD